MFNLKKFERAQIEHAKQLIAEAHDLGRLVKTKSGYKIPIPPYFKQWRRVSLNNIELRKENRKLFSENQKLRMDLIREIRRSLSTLDL